MPDDTPPVLRQSRRSQRDRSLSPSVRTKQSVKLRRGVYVDAAAWRKLRPYERHRMRVRSAALALDDPILAFESAAVVHDLPVFGEPADIHCFAPARARGYRDGNHVVHASADRKTIVVVDGVRATSLLDTTLDLIRVLPLALGVALLDAAIRKGVDVDELTALLESQVNRRGRQRARDVIDLRDPRSESVLESVSRVVIHALGYPAPELQVEFALPNGTARTDFFWRTCGLVGEADGNGKYFTTEMPTAEVVREERRREVQLRRLVRQVARWEWQDALDPVRLDAILQAAGLPRARPRPSDISPYLRDRRTRP